MTHISTFCLLSALPIVLLANIAGADDKKPPPKTTTKPTTIEIQDFSFNAAHPKAPGGPPGGGAAATGGRPSSGKH
jgi:hypothetical protein